MVSERAGTVAQVGGSDERQASIRFRRYRSHRTASRASYVLSGWMSTKHGCDRSRKGRSQRRVAGSESCMLRQPLLEGACTPVKQPGERSESGCFTGRATDRQSFGRSQTASKFDRRRASMSVPNDARFGNDHALLKASGRGRLVVYRWRSRGSFGCSIPGNGTAGEIRRRIVVRV